MGHQEWGAELAELALALATDQTLENILERVANLAEVVLGDCVAASVTLVERGEETTAASSRRLALDLDLVQYDTQAGPCLHALRTSTVVHFQAGDRRWPAFEEAARAQGVSRSLSVPLVVAEYTFGALNLYSDVPDGLASETDELVASLLAEQAAAAVATAQAFASERTTALILQRSLLPDELPTVPGYELAGRYRPANSRAEVGGDWYDAFPLPSGALAVAVGDVAGHGVEAAALMGQLRTGLRAYALEDRDPATCMALLSQLFEAREESGPQVATACLGLIDPPTGMCRMASAGHLPSALRSPDGTVRFVDGSGAPLLGAGPTDRVDDDFVHLQPGSSLVLYTDGLVEDRSRSLDDGLSALAATLAKATGSAEDICNHLMAELVQCHHQDDDVALLVILRSVDPPRAVSSG